MEELWGARQSRTGFVLSSSGGISSRGEREGLGLTRQAGGISSALRTARSHFLGRGPLFRTIGAGLFDSGCASLATFAVGLYAARVFDPAILGAYALTFAAFTLASNMASQLVFVPCEVKSVSLRRRQRLTLLRRSLWIGVPITLLASLSVWAWLLFAESGTPYDVVVALTVSAVACAIVSPIQDHVRRMLHLGDASWAAAAVSGLQLAGILALAAGAIASEIPAVWIPFGALAGANFLSLCLGLHLGWRMRDQATSPSIELPLIEALRSGRWLLSAVLLASGANFVAAGLVTQLASAAALGYAEAARICAQPIWVFVIGLRAVLGPRSMEAARGRDRARARRISQGFAWVVSVIGLGYATVTATEWWGNPLPELIPNAYVIPWLVLIWTLANIITGYQSSLRAELLGAGREAGIAMAETWASMARTLVSATAWWTGSLAMPAGFLVGAVVRWRGFRLRARRYYESPASS